MLVFFGLAIGLAVAPSAQNDAALPAGQGMDVVSKCLTCHGSDVIRQQRLARPGWLRELDKMIRWGAVLTAAEREVAADYLAANFAVSAGSAAPQSAGAAGAAGFQRRCIGCHGTDIVEQQRLGRSGWVREVDKMIRWGASVNDEEKDSLIDYLAARFGPRQPATSAVSQQ